MKYLAIDYGLKRIGLAVGAAIPKTFGIVDGALSRKKQVEKIIKICRQEEIEKIVVGWPVRSRGEEGTLANRIRAFADLLAEESGLEVILEPEQFTSAEAERLIKERGIRDYSKSQIDELAAVLLLEQYLAHVTRNT